MGKQNVPIQAFNRGLISTLGLARTNVDRVRLSAETYENWMARVLGSTMLRPGWEYLHSSKDNEVATWVPFVYALDDVAYLEMTVGDMRVAVDDTIITRASVSSAVTNGTFDSNVTSWTDADETGCTSAWEAGGYMSLIGTIYNKAIRHQEITVSVADQSVEHALRIVVERGPVDLKVGTSAGDGSYISETTLGTGEHSLAFTPTGNFFIWVAGYTQAESLIDSIAVESSGDMVLPTPYTASDLGLLRYDQSGDVIYSACGNHQPRKTERRATNSWSVVKYEPNDGPFDIINISGTRLTPSALTGDITLTASTDFFDANHVGALFRLTSVGQNVEIDITAEDQYSDHIRIVGSGTSRAFSFTRAGTWVATVTLQRSVGEPGSWVDITNYTTNGTTNYNDGLDNQTVYYRLGVKSGNFTSGTVELSMTYASGGLTGICRVTGYTSSTVVDAAVLTPMGATDATQDWSEGRWSDYRGWPSALTLYEGRLFLAGKGNFWASVSDAYESFDDTIEGDSAPIDRSIGSGPIDKISWLLPLERLLGGAQLSEQMARSTSLDEILTASNFNLKASSTLGSATVNCAKLDDTGLFVHRNGSSLYQLIFDGAKYTYIPEKLTKLVPDIGEPSIVRILVQRQPDTRIHIIRSDGKVGILIFDEAEEVKCWILQSTDGSVEDGFVLPGDVEDAVYYHVNRTINGSTKRYLEKWALESECQGGLLNKQADSFFVYDSTSTSIITGLSHLEGETVIIWADGKDVGTKTVASGQITLDTAASKVVVGLGYNADFESTKLAYAAEFGTALTQTKRVNYLGIIAKNMHYKGLKYGRDFDNLKDMPDVEDGKTTAADTIWTEYDNECFPFDGEWDTDSRLCLRASAPRPVTLLGAIISVETNEKL